MMQRLTISALALTTITVTAIPSASQANSFCQCVGYVKNALGIRQAMGNAKDMIFSLPKQGFRRVNDPRKGDVVVMNNSFPGADRTYGHVGFVESINKGQLTLRGSNQGGRQFAEAGCNNVSVISFRTNVNGRGDVSFWRR